MNQEAFREEKPSKKQLTRTIFSPGVDDKWRCRICAKQRVQATGKGYTNLVDHLHRAHSSVTINSAYQHILWYGTVTPVVDITSHAKGIHDWIEWIVMENRPLSFCESEITRKNTSLPITNAKALKKYITLLVDVARQR
ncbi:hypothetical protein L916_03136 [Phytophthora nicotianae]|uniref:BED-type domain-containing protein n=1 Tax=Phytophthora nicotianae TaxID=4792 RepID=W2JKV3_PHYNI|nr:hypothetical protein L916_03136 [Phytophthora nicotianae]